MLAETWCNDTDDGVKLEAKGVSITEEAERR